MMKKILPFCFSILCLFHAQLLNAQTVLSNATLTQNTTWTIENSPYLIQGDLYVIDNVELIINAGVEVFFEDKAGIVLRNAKITAIGTITDSIYFGFSNVLIANTNQWKGILLEEGAEITLKYCIGKNSTYFLYALPAKSSCKVQNSTFKLNNYVFYRNSNLGNYAFENCHFENNDIGVENANKVVNCFFQYHSQFALSPFGICENNEFTKNGIAVKGSFSAQNGCTFLYNNIYENKTGIAMDTFRNDIPFLNNKICNNSIFNLYKIQRNTANVQIPNNCWCTTDSTAIEESIWDGKDDASSGGSETVSFMPVLMDCNMVPPPPPTDTTDLRNPFWYLTNVSENTLTIKSADKEPIVSIKILNLSGQVVYDDAPANKLDNIPQYVNCICVDLFFEKTISLDFLPKGIYILQVNQEKPIKIVRW